jgi:ubiquinone/menaquinone biosynthesis C-methylase UbiE
VKPEQRAAILRFGTSRDKKMKGMLVKPVDCQQLYDDGRHYDLHNSQVVEDIPFYLRQARKYGEPVLELACGTGRITIPMAEQ